MSAEIVTLPSPDLVDLDGVSIATWVVEPPGSAAGDVVLCHGTPWSAQVWAEVGHRLVAAGHRVHLWDMPGYGRSTMSADAPVDLRTQMSRLAHLVDRWGLQQPHVVAHDIGGAVALGAHLLESVDYASLMLWDVVTLDPWGSPFFRLVADHESVFAQLPSRLHAALVREYVAGAAGRPLDDAWLDALVAPWTTEGGRPAFYRQIAQLRPDDTRPLVDRLDEVRTPVAIGWGEDDPWIGVDQAHLLREALPGGTPPLVVPGAGHLTPIEATGEVGDAVVRWLER